MKTIAEVLNQTPANTFHLQEKRPGLFQLIGPVFHEDGDMMSIFLERVEEDKIKISDHGLSLMRLSYLFDIDSDKKKKTLNDMILARSAMLEKGSIELIVHDEALFPGIMNFSQLVSEVCNLDTIPNKPNSPKQKYVRRTSSRA